VTIKDNIFRGACLYLGIIFILYGIKLFEENSNQSGLFNMALAFNMLAYANVTNLDQQITKKNWGKVRWGFNWVGSACYGISIVLAVIWMWLLLSAL
jgi:hypothetical protein